MNGILGFAQSLGLCSAPIIGGALTDAFTWRACFGINIPIGIVAIAITAIGMKDPCPYPDIKLPFLEKLKRIDLVGTLLIVPAIICLLMGLQWGGSKYGWGNPRIIVLFVVFAFLTTGFGYVQYRQQDRAVLPPRILKNKTVLASALFSCCLNGALAVTEFYIAIYFQGVRGYSATKAGLLGLPMIVGLAIAVIAAAFGTTWTGYYSPFMYATAILGPIAAGILTTIDLNASQLKVAALLGLLGFALGLGAQAPVTAAMTVLSPQDASIGLSVILFGAGIGSSLCIATSAALFHDRLNVEISTHAPGTNVSAIDSHGLGDLRNAIGPDRLKDVLFGYNEAVVQTLYLPLGLTLLAILGAVFTEVRSVKKKSE
jgi:MFS family permease